MALPVSLEQFIGSERLALLREVTLVPRDLGAVVPDARPGDDVVVLVHGFLASAGVFRPLRARLEREAGARVATFSHAPLVGIRRIARRLAAVVDRIPRGTRIIVVGHSLGGVVARWYVQEMGGHERVAHTVSLASPFGGVDVPQLLVGADLHAQSELLARLRAKANACGVPHTSIVAAEDTLVVGVEAACLGHGEVIVLPKRGHNQLLFCEQTAAHVIERVKRGAPAGGR
jgi:triacylglycerol lipase